MNWYVLIYDLDAFYGQSTSANLRLIGPFPTVHIARDWEEAHINEEEEDSLTLPFELLDNTLSLRAVAPNLANVGK